MNASRPNKSRKQYPNAKSDLEKTYSRLGVTTEQMAEVVLIRPLLRRAGMSMERVVETLSSDTSAEAQAFMAVYRKMKPCDRSRAPIEAIAVAANLTTRRLWEVLSGAAMQQGRDTVALMVSVAQPEVVARTIKSAKLPLGHHDREHLFKAVGFLPTPKSSNVFIRVGNPGQEDDKPDEDSDGTGSLPKMDDFLLDVQKAISPAKKQIAAPKAEVVAEFRDLPAGALE